MDSKQLDKLVKAANKKVAQHIEKVAKKVSEENTKSFAEARARLGVK